ncbi:FUSC family protein [Leifsonia sp. Root112D2]|uniref:FUSC family protein n=1 Tax=Leifsonia sp. Root112D2 TaxID=1736426 RepID=UPI0009E999D8|nr:FUSC family protein [Leifsonia sp. Root112D2]
MRTPAVGWVGQLLRPQPAPIPWARAVRSAVAIVTPVAVGMSIGQLGPGMLCAIGALSASGADLGGRYRARLYRLSVVAASGAVGFLLGGLIFGDGLMTALFVLVAGLVSGLVSVLGNVASVASLQFLIFTIVASGVNFGHGPWWLPTLFYLSGAAWALLLSMAGGIGRATAPERLAVSEVYRSLAMLMDVSGREGVDSARVNLTTAMNEAYDTVVSFRATSGGRDARVRRLGALLNAATPVVEATTTLVRSGETIPLRLTAATRAMAGAVLRSTGPVEIAAELTPDAAPSRELAALESRLGSVASLFAKAEGADSEQPRHPTFRERMLALRDAVASGPATWKPILRLVLCLAVAELVGALIPVERPYWIALTVAVTLKPDFGSVFARAVQRGVGTVVGVLIGTLLLAYVPFGVPILIALGVFAAMLPITLKRNYGMFATFLTPVIVLLLDLSRNGNEDLVVSRLLDTALGCAIVLLVGYLPWPNVWRSSSRISDRVASVTDDLLEYLRVALGADGQRTRLRRQTYRGLSDLRTVLQQALAEPPPVSRQASAWWPAVVVLERLTDAVTAVVTRVEIGGQQPAPGEAQQVIDTMQELSAAVHEQRRPRTLTLPEGGPLDGVASELRVAHAVFSGPSDD